MHLEFDQKYIKFHTLGYLAVVTLNTIITQMNILHVNQGI